MVGRKKESGRNHLQGGCPGFVGEVENLEPGKVGIRFRLGKARRGQRGLLKKRIGGFFSADGGGGSVARINNGFLGKGENFFTDAAEEKVATPPREIPTAHSVFEKDVAAKQLIGFR